MKQAAATSLLAQLCPTPLVLSSDVTVEDDKPADEVEEAESASATVLVVATVMKPLASEEDGTDDVA